MCTESRTSIYIPKTVKHICWGAFYSYYTEFLKDIYYGGTQEDWNSIIIDEDNDGLKDAVIHFSSKENYKPIKPTDKKDDEIKATEYNGHYYAVVDEEMNWEDAEAYCESLGGYLVTIADEKENAFAYKLLTDAGLKNGWLGLKANKTGIIPVPSIDGNDVDPLAWSWVNGDASLLNYSNWADGEGYANNNEKYGMFFETYTDGKWNDWGNYDSAFICEWDYNPNSISDTEFQQKQAMWEDQFLKKSCRKYDKDLASFLADFSGTAIEQNSASAIRRKYIENGIKNSDIYTDNFDGDYAFAIGSIPCEKTNVIIITARGSTTLSEFVHDYTTKVNEYNFFGYSTVDISYQFEEEIWAGINKYLDEHPYLDSGTKKVKIIVCGHSLGGAAANLVAARMDILLDRGEFMADVMKSSDVYAYTFGAIDAVSAYNYKLETRDFVVSEKCNYKVPIEDGFANIHNIYNTMDSYAPGSLNVVIFNAAGTILNIRGGKAFSMCGKFGHMHLFSEDYKDTVIFGPNNHGMGAYKDAIENGYVRQCVDVEDDGKSDLIHGAIGCPVDVQIVKNGIVVGEIKDEKVVLCNPDISMYVYDDVKHYFIPKEGYEVRIEARDSGEMTCLIEDSSGGNKCFEHIVLSPSESFIYRINNDVEVTDTQLFILNDDGAYSKEILTNGQEVEYNSFGDVLTQDLPANGIIPDGIWIAGVTDMAYTGKNLTQDFRVYDGNVLLSARKDYTVKYKNHKKAYTITDSANLTANDKKKAPQMIITMKGNYSGKETVYFSINASGTNPDKPKPEQYPITGPNITITDTSGNNALTAAYDKSGAKPALRVIYEDTILKEGRDYSLKYSGNTKYPASKASVTITGMGNYSGKKTIPISITQRAFSTASGITVVASDKAEGKKAGQYVTTVKVFDSEGKLLKAGTDYEKAITYLKDGAVLTKTDFPKAGDAITVRVTGKGGYTNNSIEATYNIVSAGQVNDIGKATFKIKPQQYNKGNAVTITSQEMFDQAFIGKSKTPLKLSADGGVTGDFMVVPGSYTKNTTKGTAKVTFMGINGKTGTKTVSYSIGTRSVKDIWYGWIRQKKYYQTNEEILALIKQYCVNNMTSPSTDKEKEVDDYLSYQFIRSSDLGNGLYAYCADALVYRTYYAGMLIMPDGTIYNKETQPEMFEKYKDYFPSSITDFSTFWNKVKNDPTYVHGGFGDDEIDDEHKEVMTKWTGTFRLDSQNAIEVIGVYEDGTIGFRFTVADASGESTVTNSYTAKFTNDAWTEFSIPYQSGINEIFRLDDTGIRVSLDIDMQGANDGLYVKM